MAAKKPTRNSKKGAWFYPVRGSYLPCSWQGWLMYVLTILYVFSAIVVDFAKDQSTVYIVTGFVTRLLVAGVVLTLVASKKS